MRTITDAAGRRWTIALNYTTGRLARAAGVNLFDPAIFGIALTGFLDPLFVRDAFAAMLTGQNPPLADLDIAMAGKMLDDAAEAILGESLDFFQGRRAENPVMVQMAIAKCQSEAILSKLGNPPTSPLTSAVGSPELSV